MSKAEFVSICKDQKFWKWIKNRSPVKYEIIEDKEKFLSDLFKKIQNRSYYPNPPKEYITINKGNSVLRIIPVLSLEDLCVYYYCARKLEKYIAYNRTSGTYGGYGLSGKLRQLEEKEAKNIKDNLEIIELDNKKYVFSEINGYMTLTSLNSKAWFAEWGDFTSKLYFYSNEYTDGYVAELDISNYYDSIQLDNLEYKLRKYVPNNCNDIIYLVIHFLRFWNRHVNFYRQQGAGIPQDTFGECSRILANFYLQSYDKNISNFCNQKNSKFFRYADDQIIIAKTRSDLEEIIAKASSLLMRDGLNFNQKKVKIMPIKEFKKYYSFKNFLDLTSEKPQKIKKDIVDKQILFYFKNKTNLKKGGLSLLRKLLGVISEMKHKPNNLKKLKTYLLKDLIVNNYSLSTSDLDRIYKIFNKREKEKMVIILNKQIDSSWYTDHLYNIKSFYKLNKIKTRDINKRITSIRKFYDFERIKI